MDPGNPGVTYMIELVADLPGEPGRVLGPAVAADQQGDELSVLGLPEVGRGHAFRFDVSALPDGARLKPGTRLTIRALVDGAIMASSTAEMQPSS